MGISNTVFGSGDAATVPEDAGTPSRDGLFEMAAVDPSEHGLGRCAGRVFANAGAQDSYRRLGTFAEGATLLEEHTCGRETFTYAMQKTRGAWSFSGSPQPTDQALALCEACHRDAPSDHVFHLVGALRDAR